MLKVNKIIWGNEVHDEGCTNGNYQPATLVLSDGTKMSVDVCRCGNGCSGTARIHHHDFESGRDVLIEDLEFKDLDDLEDYLYNN